MAETSSQVECPVCGAQVDGRLINQHLDNNCASTSLSPRGSSQRPNTQNSQAGKTPAGVAPIFNMSQSRTQTSASGDAASREDAGPSKKRAHDEHAASSQAPAAKRGKTVASNLYAAAPLAEKLRPRSLEDFVGQSHLTAPDSLLMNTLGNGALGSLIFWGPPGCGKTTLARLLAKQSNAVFKELSATVVGINDVRAVFEEAKNTLSLTGRRTVLFLDEVHRFNKAQQDIFLPFVEQGHIQLVGATTENPSFKLTSALLSRCRVFVLEKLTEDDIKQILLRALTRASETSTSAEEVQALPNGPSSSQTLVSSPPSISPQSSQESQDGVHPHFPAFPQVTSKVISSIVSLSTGDARVALSLLELVLTSPTSSKEEHLLTSLRRSVSASYDRTGESHYDMISALHKSVRGSQGSAAMYWLARMLEGGEDPMYIARRMVVCASEDIGLADNHALPLAMATLQACERIGMPECRINLAHLIAYLSEAPKSTRSYEAYNRAVAAAKLDLTIPVPMAVRNAPTKLMKELGYGHEYRYNPDYIHPVHNDYLPIQFRDDVFLKKEGDTSEKIWDEQALRVWENEVNGGREWEGRKAMDTDTSNEK